MSAHIYYALQTAGYENSLPKTGRGRPVAQTAMAEGLLLIGTPSVVLPCLASTASHR